jgi:PTH1 family peptidyl-tRNA hydrolase
VIAALGSPDFLRVRVGVGRPPADFRGDEADWVLRAFDEPADEVAALLDAGLTMTEAVLADGIDAAIARFHARPAGERARARAERREAVAGDEGVQEPPAGGPAS